MTPRERANILLAYISLILPENVSDEDAIAIRDKCQDAISQALEDAAMVVTDSLIDNELAEEIVAAIRALKDKPSNDIWLEEPGQITDEQLAFLKGK